MSNDRTPTDLPELPEGWVETDVGSLMSLIQYGHTASASARATGPRFLRITDIQDGRVDWDTVPSCDLTVEEQEKYRLRPRDLVFARTGATTGKSYLIRTPPDAVFASYLIRLRTTQGIDPAFVYWFFQSASYWSQISKGKRGVGQPNVNATILASLQAPVAPSSEQHRIVARLDELFSQLDAGVAALERAQAKLKRYRASVLKAAVEGKMTEEWRRKNPPDETGAELLRRILVERRNRWEEEQLAKFNAKGQKPPKNWQQKYKEPVEPNTSELPELPEGWCWATMDQFAETASGGTPSRMEPSYFGGSIPWVKSGELEDRLVVHCKETITERGLRASSARIFPSGTLCVALYGATVGKLGLLGMDAATNQAVCGIFLPSYIFTTYLFHYFRAIRPQLMRRGRGGAQPNISQQIIRATLVAVPPRTEQVVIASEVDRHLSLINQTSRTLTFGIERASRVRQSILKRAFEGRLVPQDPNDEPASLLLERIRVSREAERPKKSRRSTASTERIQNS